MPPKLVATGVAAREIGVDRGTLHRWWQNGEVTPAFVTQGGHARWDVDDLRKQLSGVTGRAVGCSAMLRTWGIADDMCHLFVDRDQVTDGIIIKTACGRWLIPGRLGVADSLPVCPICREADATDREAADKPEDAQPG